MASERRGVSEAALCGKDQGFSSLPIKAGWLGWGGGKRTREGRERQEPPALMLPILYASGDSWGRAKINPPGSAHDGATGLLWVSLYPAGSWARLPFPRSMFRQAWQCWKSQVQTSIKRTTRTTTTKRCLTRAAAWGCNACTLRRNRPGRGLTTTAHPQSCDKPGLQC